LRRVSSAEEHALGFRHLVFYKKSFWNMRKRKGRSLQKEKVSPIDLAFRTNRTQ